MWFAWAGSRPTKSRRAATRSPTPEGRATCHPIAEMPSARDRPTINALRSIAGRSPHRHPHKLMNAGLLDGPIAISLRRVQARVHKHRLWPAACRSGVSRYHGAFTPSNGIKHLPSTLTSLNGRKPRPFSWTAAVAQHFLMSAAARTLSLVDLCDLSEDAAHKMLCAMRWPTPTAPRSAPSATARPSTPIGWTCPGFVDG